MKGTKDYLQTFNSPPLMFEVPNRLLQEVLSKNAVDPLTLSCADVAEVISLADRF